MQAVASVHLVSLLIATAVLAACLILTSILARRNKRRSRGAFVLGFACGLVAGPVLRDRRRRRALLVVARRLPLRRLPVRRVRSR